MLRPPHAMMRGSFGELLNRRGDREINSFARKEERKKVSALPAAPAIPRRVKEAEHESSWRRRIGAGMESWRNNCNPPRQRRQRRSVSCKRGASDNAAIGKAGGGGRVRNGEDGVPVTERRGREGHSSLPSAKLPRRS